MPEWYDGAAASAACDVTGEVCADDNALAIAMGGSLKKSGGAGYLLAVVFVPMMLFAAFASWALASPVGSSPDDDYHMASIWCAQGTSELCEEGETASERKVPFVLLSSSGCYAFDPLASASCPSPPVTELRNSDRGNFIGAYPPVFYTTMAIFAGSDISLSIVLMRMLNALLFVGTVTGLFFLLPVNRRGPLLWGGVITLVPLGMFIVPSVNPSSWAVLSALTLWVALLGYFQASTTAKRIALGSMAVLVAVMGAGARSDSAVYAGVAIVVATVLAYKRTSQFARLAILPVGLIVVALAFFFTSGQSAVIDPGSTPNESSMGSKIGLAMANLVALPGLWTGALGTTGLGWLDTLMPATVWASTLAVFFSLVFWGLQRTSPRKSIALALVFACLVVVPLYILVKDGVLVGAGVQPRYIYPLIIMLAGIALLRLRRNDLGLSRVQLLLTVILLSVANSVALHTNIRRYVTGVDGVGPNLDAGIEWWWNIPISPMAVWVFGSATFALALLGVYRYVRLNVPGSGLAEGTQSAAVLPKSK